MIDPFDAAAPRYPTDKIPSGLVNIYKSLFQPWFDHPITLLEIGIHQGGSLLMWRDFFPRGTIVGVDVQLPASFPATPGVYIYQGDQRNTAFLSEVARRHAPEGFDIVIDDASHIGEYTKTTFWHLFDHHLKPGGLYAVEDWGTGYWDDWPDGRSVDFEAYAPDKLLPELDWARPHPRWKAPWPNHSCGMVGFVKQLVDEQGALDATRRTLHGSPARGPKFAHMFITTGLVCVKKAGA